MTENAPNAVTGFAGLHHADEPLLLPNAWDHASAAALAAQGFRAVGTTSLAVAAAAGLPDGAAATREQTLLLARTLGPGPYWLSVDAEDGFSDDPEEVASFARELYRAGAAGINLEDGLAPVGRHAAKIAAVRAAVPGLFVNARTDTYWTARPGTDGRTRREDTFRRLDAYQQAGAQGVFVPGLTEPHEIAALVHRLDVPLNVLYSPTGPSALQLAGLGVRRISLGSLLYRRALGAAVETATDVREGRTPTGAVPAYAEVQALSRHSVRGGAGTTVVFGRPRCD
ncbi:isocitrate lyase/PEP mutase family protein [Streptomyces prasinopilosus]|uniref:isocitrate lyase/PEP mutase family protein n=1 Tax=Streptomyces prasinopilosus TaxID=67344 RepID=UPI0006EB80F9|nr:isocitrate lyase/phosphoenolpyruvate mutase family protein [Streptomyces prasinopilosus]